MDQISKRCLLPWVLTLLAYPTLASADVAIYADLLHNVEGTSVTVSAYGVAEGDEFCSQVITVDVYLFRQPGNIMLASNSNSDWCYASATAELTQDVSNWTDGDYESRATAEGHYCASAIDAMSTNYWDYIRDSQVAPNVWRYERCNPGFCQFMQIVQSNPPQFLNMAVFRIFGFCYTISVATIMSCPP